VRERRIGPELRLQLLGGRKHAGVEDRGAGLSVHAFRQEESESAL
jgi:hypothetical protein